jgi:hypothetical protein
VDHWLEPKDGQYDEGKVVIGRDDHAIERRAGIFARGAIAIDRTAHLRGCEDSGRRRIDGSGGTDCEL